MKKIKALEWRYEALKSIGASIEDINNIDVKNNFAGNKVIKTNDYNKIIALAKERIIMEDRIQQLIFENKSLKEEVEAKDQSLKGAKITLSRLKTQRNKLAANMKKAKEQGEAMFETLEKHDLVNEATEYMYAKRVSEKVINKKNLNYQNER